MVKVNLAGVQDEFPELPRGLYHVNIVDGEVRETGEDTKHPETEYWNLEFEIQDGKYAGQKLWTNVMLPPYEVFTLKNILRSSGRVDEEELESGDFEVELLPEDADGDTLALLDGDWHMIAVYGKNKKSGRMEIRRFKPYDEDEWVPADDEDDELP